MIHDHYFARVDDFDIPYPVGGSMANGLSDIRVILFGEGDFIRTVGMATSAGYDCDNQAATCGGLIGVIQGASSIPTHFTLGLNPSLHWSKPFNDQYINYSRENLPNFNTITDVIDRIVKITEKPSTAWEENRKSGTENVTC